ncbi:PQQ-like beta-propeller repeat protein [Planctellipticum variicoloris]|uniref:PQQ-like beta-propeller repeat protein n=1 Tax=Planctellipticum variicoloris TaxID=3064265 RepID=UPI003013E38B|nr:PQQ-binding-like beta-propeller repeat protein [Planctomycetaceae bacterium SH412]
MRFLAFGLSLTLAVSAANAADWRQFRGSDTTGVADGKAPPTSWENGENIAWKRELPGRGLSTPIVVGDKVFVTACTGYLQDRLHVLCFDDKSGDLLWERQFWALGRSTGHPKMSNATPTPASDGQRVFAFYSSNDVICLDLDGNLQWFRALTWDHPNASNSLGMSSSPIVVGDTLVVQFENDSDSLATGLNVETGESRWTSPRPKKANWTSPVVLPGKTRADDLALLQSSAGLAAVKPLTGEVVWQYTDGASTIPSSVVHHGLVYIPSNGITAIRPPVDSASVEQLWRGEKLRPGTGSPTVYRDKIFVINSAGVLICASLENGEVAWQTRVEGPFSATPVAAGDNLYLFNERGLGQVVSIAGEKGEVVGKGDLGETILCTPAVANGAIYTRSDNHLWKIAAP